MEWRVGDCWMGVGRASASAGDEITGATGRE